MNPNEPVVDAFKIDQLHHGASYLIQHSTNRDSNGAYAWSSPYETRLSYGKRVHGYWLTISGLEFTESHYCGNGVFDRGNGTPAIRIIGLDGAQVVQALRPRPAPLQGYRLAYITNVRVDDSFTSFNAADADVLRALDGAALTDSYAPALPAVIAASQLDAASRLQQIAREYLERVLGSRLFNRCKDQLRFEFSYKELDAQQRISLNNLSLTMYSDCRAYPVVGNIES